MPLEIITSFNEIEVELYVRTYYYYAHRVLVHAMRENAFLFECFKVLWPTLYPLNFNESVSLSI